MFNTLLPMGALSQSVVVAVASLLLAIFLVLRGLCQRRSNTIKPPPLRVLSRVAKFLFSQSTYEIVFETLRAEVSDEHNRALHQQQRAKATWIVLTGNLILLANILRQIVDPIYELIDRVKRAAR